MVPQLQQKEEAAKDLARKQEKKAQRQVKLHPREADSLPVYRTSRTVGCFAASQREHGYSRKPRHSSNGCLL